MRSEDLSFDCECECDCEWEWECSWISSFEREIYRKDLSLEYYRSRLLAFMELLCYFEGFFVWGAG